jgi:hypothetical protein
MELIEHVAIREASAAKPVVVPEGERYGTVDLRGLYETVEKDLMGRGGSLELIPLQILPSQAGLRPGEMADLTKIRTGAYELMNDKGRGEISGDV